MHCRSYPSLDPMPGIGSLDRRNPIHDSCDVVGLDQINGRRTLTQTTQTPSASHIDGHRAKSAIRDRMPVASSP